MILHLASKRAISATPFQYATGYTRRFCGMIRKIMINLIKVSEFNESLLKIMRSIMPNLAFECDLSR